ncbi:MULTISPECIES: hypothetical protein [Falsihalocynthiibacter]|uniref:hypothetical protein n=1 Tax=Falsihalocynthiibacter TaxID=2854182 RepID=UPI003003642F
MKIRTKRPKPEFILGVSAAPPRLTREAIRFLVLRVGIPLIAALISIDLLVWLI